jgi:NAD(P)-dependent dehydrogenase (short-subunit alcohol dehydrogenase family)
MSVAYTSTKHGVTGLTKCISLDGRKNEIAASQIDIGNALTDHPAGMTNGERLMDVKHAGDPVRHMSNVPLDVNVQFMTIMATKNAVRHPRQHAARHHRRWRNAVLRGERQGTSTIASP